MRKVALTVSFLLVVGLLVGCGGAAPDVDWTLGVSGAVSSPLAIGYAELVGMPQSELDADPDGKIAGRRHHRRLERRLT